MARFAVNDRVIYHQSEYSTRPAPNAHDVSAAERGEMYSYVVDRFWRVVCVNTDGTIDAVGSDGRLYNVPASDDRLERVRWWHRLTYRRFFAGV
jgi:hypothetical protein